ncbi:hypothetical protein T4B_3934 [Trichinella pseudospiralis]|uniref:Uncharacterized protein n=1 Tax=Trichinella pseudospiralis TaxID=6337 RepID=A0A0V1IHM9_TRIPS|nr:hypothetical protein T4B_3934 [Trichinella pseudospiralis]
MFLRGNMPKTLTQGKSDSSSKQLNQLLRYVHQCLELLTAGAARVCKTRDGFTRFLAKLFTPLLQVVLIIKAAPSIRHQPQL